MTTRHELLLCLMMLGPLSACGGRIGLEAIPGPEAGPELPPVIIDASPEAVDPNPFGCEEVENQAPSRLECSGLYANWWTKQLAPRVWAYAPATSLWSDGADKYRWIYLPPGTTIDASSRADWVFPIGTKFWKEFRVHGKKIETRLFQKMRADRWVTAAYGWSKDESTTSSSMGGDTDVDLGGGVPYHIATQKECSDCHKGRQDRILGFEEILLGTPGATGLTLAALVAEGLLSPPPPRVDLHIPDDGTGASTPALAWIHVNCGITCHNRFSAATGNGTRLFLRLDPAALDAVPASDWDPVQTTLRVGAITPGWNGEMRIVPGLPEQSLLVRLISSRGEEKMPPVGSHLVDVRSVDQVKEWIRRMPRDPIEDGGAADGALDGRVTDEGD